MTGMYIEDARICLAKFDARDYALAYQSWQEQDIIVAYNWQMNRTFSEYLASASAGGSWGASIRDKAHGEIVGRISISPGNDPDLTITIYAGFRQNGYGVAACRLAIRYAFSFLQLKRLTAGCYEDNTASHRMLISSGFRRHPEGDIREPHVLTGEDRLQYDFIIEERDWGRVDDTPSPVNPV